MKRILSVVAVVAMSCSFLYAKGQLAIVGYAYLNPEIAYNEETQAQLIGLDILGAAANWFFGQSQDATITGTVLTPVLKSGGKISVNGKYVGDTSEKIATIVSVSPGNHTVKVCYP